MELPWGSESADNDERERGNGGPETDRCGDVADRDNYFIRASQAFEGEQRVFVRSWDRSVPRDMI